MRNSAKNLALSFLLLSFVCFGCATAKEVPPKTAKASDPAVQQPKTGTAYAQKSEAVTTEVAKTAAEENAMDAMIKKYSTAAAPKSSGKRTAPDFQLQDIFYDTYSLQDYKDSQQPVLLFFWTTWCPYCQNELRMMRDRYPKFVESGLEVLAINVGETMQQVSDFVRNINPGFKVLVDNDTTVSGAYRVAGVPTYILIDKDGNIVFQDNTFPEGYQNLISSQDTAK